MAKSSFEALINSKTPLLIDFYADWCGPCKSFSPIIEQLKDDMGDSVRVIKIDVDKNQALSTKLKITSIPSVMIYKEGKLHYEGKGMHTLQQLKSKLSGLL
ncbi:MAG: thioredoxin [Saprospiraceae bacterium]|nr:thioredoxin [Saprospiraceae bacterium]